MIVFDGKMLRIKAGKRHVVEMDVVFHLPALYVGVYFKKKPTITHIWITPLPTLQLRVSIVKTVGKQV